MTIGVTGAAGFLGANLLRHLAGAAAAGTRLVAFYSRRPGNPLTDGLPLSPAHLDVTCREEVLERTRGLDALFHLAGAVDFSRQGLRRTWDVNVKGAANVFEAVAANRIGRLVYVSSISVLGLPPADRDFADEGNDPYAAPGNPISFRDSAEALQAARGYCAGDDAFLAKVRVPYFDSKLAAYELAREYRRTRDLPIVITFPGTAVGAGDTGMSIGRLVGLGLQQRHRALGEVVVLVHARAELPVHAVEELAAVSAVAGLHDHEVASVDQPVDDGAVGQLAVGWAEPDLGVADVERDLPAKPLAQRGRDDPSLGVGDVGYCHGAGTRRPPPGAGG